MCVVLFLLGMLSFHLLKGFCGCKVVEGNGGATPTEADNDAPTTSDSGTTTVTCGTDASKTSVSLIKNCTQGTTDSLPDCTCEGGTVTVAESGMADQYVCYGCAPPGWTPPDTDDDEDEDEDDDGIPDCIASQMTGSYNEKTHMLCSDTLDKTTCSPSEITEINDAFSQLCTTV